MRYCVLILFLILVGSVNVYAQTYDVGNPTIREIWVNPNSGSDSNAGNSRSNALRTINAAWNLIPRAQTLTTGYKILLTAGSYSEDTIPNYWEDRRGTFTYPIIIQAIDGQSTATLKGDINAFNVDYFYLIDLSIIPEPVGDAFHCEQCDYLLLKGVTLSGGDRGAHETLKINQSQHVYIEDSDISGADDNSIDFVAVQYGHIVRNKIHNANDWCVYVKGGSAQILVQANRIYDCGTGGFTAGQGTGLEFMVSPWLHYEAYDIKFINNLVYRTNGAGFGVNGGYNILLAHNTLYKVGRNSHAVEVVYGYRSCDGDLNTCNSRLSQGAWGTNQLGVEGEAIPNKNVYVFNNIIYNPSGFESRYAQFAIYGPRSTNLNSNLPNPVHTDTNLSIKGNLIYNDAPSLGIEDSDQGCQPSNTTCNASQLISDNYINQELPNFIDAENGDFRLSTLISRSPANIPSFIGDDRPTPPLAPIGDLNNFVVKDFTNLIRSEQNSIGAHVTQIREADAYLSWNSFLSMINIVELVNKSSSPQSILLTVYDTTGNANSQITVNLLANSQNDIILNDLSGFRDNSYGLVALKYSSEDIEARLSVYRLSKITNNFDYAYSTSKLQNLRGITSVAFNTMQPSENINDANLTVANWLSITNPDPINSQSFTIYRYDQSGNLITTKDIFVPAFGRYDIEGGHETPGRQRVGFNRIVPNDLNADYFASIVRYGVDHGRERDFQFAYPIFAEQGDANQKFMSISNGGNAQNWIEITNVSDQIATISLESYSSSGQAIGQNAIVSITPNSQYHYYASQNLDAGASGILKITSNNAIIAHSLFYFYSSERDINSMYGLASLKLNSGAGSYNLFLGMSNWLKISNLSNQSKTASIKLYLGSQLLTEQSFTISSLATIELPLHEQNRFNTIANSYGTVEISGDGLSSHVLRVRSINNEIDFVFPTEVN